MKRSAAVPLTLVTTLSAGALAACGPRQEPMQCVEKNTGRVMPDSVCARAGVAPGTAETGAAPGAAAAGGQQPGVHYGGSPFPAIFAWYYGGRIVNGLVSGGSYAPLAGRRYRSAAGFVATPRTAGGRGGFGNASPARSGTSRGGFGATGAGRFGGS